MLTRKLKKTAPSHPELACDGIRDVLEWSAEISLTWAHCMTNPGGHRIHAQQSMCIKSTLESVASSEACVEWSGVPTGKAAISESDTDLNLQPNPIATLRGAGTVLCRHGRVPLPRVTLEVDLITRQYRLWVAPWIAATITDFNGFSTRTTTTVGLLQSGLITVGDWRTAGLAFEGSFPAHSPAWADFNRTTRAYLPYGFAQLMFVETPKWPAGNANAKWVITRK